MGVFAPQHLVIWHKSGCVRVSDIFFDLDASVGLYSYMHTPPLAPLSHLGVPLCMSVTVCMYVPLLSQHSLTSVRLLCFLHTRALPHVLLSFALRPGRSWLSRAVRTSVHLPPAPDTPDGFLRQGTKPRLVMALSKRLLLALEVLIVFCNTAHQTALSR